MFKNKSLKIFTQRMVEKFARKSKNHVSEQLTFSVLWSSYASVNRKLTKDSFTDKDGRQLLYFQWSFGGSASKQFAKPWNLSSC